MKVRIKINVENVHVDEVVEGDSDAAIAAELRRQLEARSPFMVRLVLGTMSDQALWRKVVEMHNHRHRTNEPTPNTAAEFLAFGERVGYVERLA